MTTVKELDSIRTTVDVKDIDEGRTIPASTEGAVVDVYPDGGCLVDITLRPQTEDDPGDFVQAELKPDQFEVIQTA